MLNSIFFFSPLYPLKYHAFDYVQSQFWASFSRNNFISSFCIHFKGKTANVGFFFSFSDKSNH